MSLVTLRRVSLIGRSGGAEGVRAEALLGVPDFIANYPNGLYGESRGIPTFLGARRFFTKKTRGDLLYSI